jgi:hypothetical protein
MSDNRIVLPPCPCCGKPLDSPWAVDHFIDSRERLWHWECAGRVLGAYAAEAEQ